MEGVGAARTNLVRIVLRPPGPPAVADVGPRDHRHLDRLSPMAAAPSAPRCGEGRHCQFAVRGQLPLRPGQHQLPGVICAPIALPALLVARRGGAVLSGLAGDPPRDLELVAPDRPPRQAQPNRHTGQGGGGFGRDLRRILRLVPLAHLSQPALGVLLAAHPGLGIARAASWPWPCRGAIAFHPPPPSASGGVGWP